MGVFYFLLISLRFFSFFRYLLIAYKFDISIRNKKTSHIFLQKSQKDMGHKSYDDSSKPSQVMDGYGVARGNNYSRRSDRPLRSQNRLALRITSFFKMQNSIIYYK